MPTPANTRASLFSALGHLSDEIQGEKRAAVKSAGPTPADPGGYQGATTHASKDIDNGVQNASEGSRSAENTADVKEQQGEISVDSTKEKSQEGRQDEVQLNLGMHASAVGEDASVEDDYKPGKDDPGTDHPARTDNDSLDGHKYASASFGDLLKASAAKGNRLLADLSIGLGTNLDKPGVAPVKQAGAAAPAPAAAPAAAAASAGAGYELATQLGLSKEAAVAEVSDVIAEAIYDAQLNAELFAGAYKQAADEADVEGGEDHSAPGDVGSGAGEGDPTGGGGGGAPPGGDVPLEQSPPGDAEAVQELTMALQEMGISPQELLQMLQSAGPPGGGDPAMGGGAPPGGAGGGMPPPGGDPMMGGGDPAMGGGDPMAGGMPPIKAAWVREGHKLASAAHHHMRSGKFQIKAATTKRARDLRDRMKSHLSELLTNIRA